MFEVIEFAAVVTAALFGILQARAARMDALGVFTVAFAVAFGGGTLRDLFLDRHPLFWIANSHYTIIVFVMAIVTCMIPRMPAAYKKYLSIPDAIGLGLFSIVGVQFALEAGTSYFIAAVLGVTTGTFGGVISDIFCARVPSLFQPAPLLATCSFLGSWVFLGFVWLNLSDQLAAFAGIATVVVTRLAALYWNICLPAVGGDDE